MESNDKGYEQVVDALLKLEEGVPYRLPPEFLKSIQMIDFEKQKERILTFHREWERELRYDEGKSEGEEGPFYFGKEGVKLATVTRKREPYKQEAPHNEHGCPIGPVSGRGEESGHELWLLGSNELGMFLYCHKQTFSPGSSTGADEDETIRTSSLVKLVSYVDIGDCSCKKINLHHLGLDIILKLK